MAVDLDSVDTVDPDGLVAAARSFTRAWTVVNDVLNETYLGSPFSLAEARILFELAAGGEQPLVALRGRLRLDAGYATRMLAGLAERGLVRRRVDPADGRRLLLALTPAGQAAAADLDARASRQVGELLSGLSEDGRRRLRESLDQARRVLGGESASSVRLRPLQPGDLGWILERHAVLYRAEFGWGAHFEASVAQIVAGIAAAVAAQATAPGGHGQAEPAARGWIAVGEGGRLGSVVCTREADRVARLRLLLVEPSARGLGVGGRLVDACVDFARAAGFRRVMLTTQDACVAARRIYAARGFQLVRTSREDSYDPNGVNETWHLELAES